MTASGSENALGRPVPALRGTGARAEPHGLETVETANLIAEFLSGRPEAVRLLADWAESVARHRAWGFQSPEDVVQSTMLAVFQNLRDGRFEPGNLRAYVQRIAKNLCITHYRRALVRGVQISHDDNIATAPFKDSTEDLANRDLFARILERLEESCRQIILLAYLHGYSRREIGERLGISEQAARVRLSRCISKGRKHMDELSVDGVDIAGS